MWRIPPIPGTIPTSICQGQLPSFHNNGYRIRGGGAACYLQSTQDRQRCAPTLPNICVTLLDTPTDQDGPMIHIVDLLSRMAFAPRDNWNICMPEQDPNKLVAKYS